jgi:hypothetical protein
MLLNRLLYRLQRCSPATTRGRQGVAVLVKAHPPNKDLRHMESRSLLHLASHSKADMVVALAGMAVAPVDMAVVLVGMEVVLVGMAVVKVGTVGVQVGDGGMMGGLTGGTIKAWRPLHLRTTELGRHKGRIHHSSHCLKLLIKTVCGN